MTTVQPTTIQETTLITCIKDPNPKSIVPSSFNTNTCPKNYVFEPTSLSLTKIYNYEFPIMQNIVCFGARFELKCPTNLLIHIYSAYYGIQPSTNTNYCITGKVIHQVCYREVTYTNLAELCENRNSCGATVTDAFFGDPCSGSKNHQLFIQYQCIDLAKKSEISICQTNRTRASICPALSNPGTQFQQYWCEPDVLRISCSSGRVIRVLCAFYGIDPNIRCLGGFYFGAPSTCYSSSSFTQIETECNNKQSCTIFGDTSFEVDSGFANPCAGFQNMIFVQWECVSTPIVTVATTQSPTTLSTLPFCSVESTLNGTCNPDSFSIFEPKFMDNSSTTYFSYPIYQQIVCAGTRLIITCPTDLVIHTYAAYFGIQSHTPTTTCQRAFDEQPAMCYISNAFNTINSSCEFKNSCSLRATVGTMGGADLCPSYSKQLLVQYQCVDTSALTKFIYNCTVNKNVPLVCPVVDVNLTPALEEKTWCDGSIMSIKCPSNQVIEIVCAFYGIHPAITECPSIQLLTFKPVCYFKSSFTIVNATCTRKNSCFLSSFSTSFIDPCVDLDKALYVQWKCV